MLFVMVYTRSWWQVKYRWKLLLTTESEQEALEAFMALPKPTPKRAIVFSEHKTICDSWDYQ